MAFPSLGLSDLESGYLGVIKPIGGGREKGVVVLYLRREGWGGGEKRWGDREKVG